MNKKKKYYISLVIPVYNEVKRLPLGLKSTLEYFKKQKYSWEIVLVDDGSTDRTSKLIQQTLRGQPYQLIRHSQNRGKGAAVRSGMLVAHGKYVVFSDIDMSTPLIELPKLLRALKTHDLAIGVRRHPDSVVSVHQPKLREFLGHIFTKITNLLVTPGIYDATCGFKAYRAEVARKLYSLSRIGRWAFDAEILFIAKKKHYSIAQIPVVWSNNSATKVHVLNDGIRAFIDVVKIRVMDLRSTYF